MLGDFVRRERGAINERWADLRGTMTYEAVIGEAQPALEKQLEAVASALDAEHETLTRAVVSNEVSGRLAEGCRASDLVWEWVVLGRAVQTVWLERHGATSGSEAQRIDRILQTAVTCAIESAAE